MERPLPTHRRPVYASGATIKGRTCDVAEPTDSWARRDLQGVTTPGKLATKVVLDVSSTGVLYELEATTVTENGFIAAFLAELTTFSARAGMARPGPRQAFGRCAARS